MEYKNLIGGAITDKISIYNCDCMELLKQTPDNYYSLALVDPPYGINANNHAGKEENGWNQYKKSDWDNSIPSEQYFKELFRVSKNQIIWGGNYMTEYLKPSMGWIIWDKGQRDFSLADGEMAWTSFDRALRVFDFSRAKLNKERGDHPTEKPVALYKWLLKNYAKEGDKILDTHLGSGSIAIACHDYKFDLVGCELDKDYYDAAVKRFNNHKAQQTIF